MSKALLHGIWQGIFSAFRRPAKLASISALFTMAEFPGPHEQRRRPSDPHHRRFAQSRAIGRKISDEFTVPLCRGHHRELHRSSIDASGARSPRETALRLPRICPLPDPHIERPADQISARSCMLGFVLPSCYHYV
jgi:hypothetical protein